MTCTLPFSLVFFSYIDILFQGRKFCPFVIVSVKLSYKTAQREMRFSGEMDLKLHSGRIIFHYKKIWISKVCLSHWLKFRLTALCKHEYVQIYLFLVSDVSLNLSVHSSKDFIYVWATVSFGGREYFPLWTSVVGEVNRRLIIYTQVLKPSLFLMHAALPKTNRWPSGSQRRRLVSLKTKEFILGWLLQWKFLVYCLGNFLP